MAAYIESIYAAIRTAVAATWTDVNVNGIFEVEHEEMIPWADLTPPCAAILVPSMPKTDDWGITWNAFTPRIEVYYVANVPGSSGVIRAKLEALRDYLLVTGLSVGQVLMVDDLCWSDELLANQIMINKDYGQRCGRLMATCVIGEVYP